MPILRHKVSSPDNHTAKCEPGLSSWPLCDPIVVAPHPTPSPWTDVTTDTLSIRHTCSLSSTYSRALVTVFSSLVDLDPFLFCRSEQQPVYREVIIYCIDTMARNAFVKLERIPPQLYIQLGSQMRRITPCFVNADRFTRSRITGRHLQPMGAATPPGFRGSHANHQRLTTELARQSGRNLPDLS